MAHVRALLGVPIFLLGGCSGRDSTSVLPTSADPSLSSRAQTPDAAVTDRTSVDATYSTAEAELTAVDPIVAAAAPDVAGTYEGTIQDRTPSYGFVDRGTIRFVLHQSGSSVSGTMKITSTEGTKVAYTFTGTAADTAKGAILHLAIADMTGRTVGLWAKVIGSTLFGKGWADPDTYQTYEQLLFTMHKT